MKLEGTISKAGKFWAVHMPLLDAYTQGRTRKEALFMAIDWIASMADGLVATAQLTSPTTFLVTCADESAMMALALRQQREAHHLTARQAAANLGQTSPNAYARFERRKSKISLEKFALLLGAVGVQADVVVRLGAMRNTR